VVTIRDASSCGPIADASVALTLTNLGTQTELTSTEGTATLIDCVLARSTVVATKELFCSADATVRLDTTLTSTRQLLELRPIQSKYKINF
jgi:hypothetical protein